MGEATDRGKWTPYGEQCAAQRDQPSYPPTTAPGSTSVEILTQRSLFLEAELEKKSRQLQEKTEQARTETEKNNAAKEVIKTLMMQNEALNGCGTLFVNKHPNLKVRVVHGNTLTASVILNEIPRDLNEVFLTGATSKLGRSIALYLARRRVRVLVIQFDAR